ncbi:MAG: F0F1 ATP synthase subunit B' [Aphanocapsa feldmannii 277cV]|uniref:ATP synthase subunit b' n=2 Tax=Aphanocapsa feldmannii TaxID=192050 RepID=A0A524RLS7_9CHRO|nr:MAG: F0F1 ATP synthase subunit B' [Aphanocapsa feldmannii 288cV]TGG90996.1 MAG: F0F1 ATP synthase subunit B' [Aphanocapsa feldmannii 277cV]TGH24342.1 MAG: F0F1 ATP synthase subunit B' [Aphanocapsa feldmannii 277cI]
MTSWLSLAATAPPPEGGLFDLNATLPLMAVQVVILTFILNKLFFRPIGHAVENREGYVATSRSQAKERLAKVERLEAELKARLRDARQQAQTLIAEAEAEVRQLHREALGAAMAEANAVREAARRDIDKERASAAEVLEQNARDLGDLIVKRLLPA